MICLCWTFHNRSTIRRMWIFASHTHTHSLCLWLKASISQTMIKQKENSHCWAKPSFGRPPHHTIFSSTGLFLYHFPGGKSNEWSCEAYSELSVSLYIVGRDSRLERRSQKPTHKKLNTSFPDCVSPSKTVIKKNYQKKYSKCGRETENSVFLHAFVWDNCQATQPTTITIIQNYIVLISISVRNRNIVSLRKIWHAVSLFLSVHE